MSKSQRINSLIEKAGRLYKLAVSVQEDLFNLAKEGITDVAKTQQYNLLMGQYVACRNKIADLSA